MAKEWNGMNEHGRIAASPSTAAQGATLTDERLLQLSDEIGGYVSEPGDLVTLTIPELRAIIAAAPKPVADSGLLGLIRRIQQGQPFSRIEVLDALEACGAFELAAAKPVSVDANWHEAFHKAAMTYRAASVMQAPDAYDALLALVISVPTKST